MSLASSLRRHPDFLRAWSGQLASVIGDGLYRVAILWWVKSSTGSDALVALVALCGAVPLVALGPLAGAVADRLDRRRLMISMDLARAVLVLVPAGLLAWNRLEPWHLAAVAALLSACSAFFGPAYGASLPQLAPPDRLGAANALNQGGLALAGLVGPALGGLLVAAVGPAQAVLVDAMTFLASALLLALSRVPSPARATENSSLRRDMLEGLAFMLGHPVLRGGVALFAAINFFWAPLGALLPGLARDVLGADAIGFGLLEAMFPAGFAIGGALTPLLLRRTGSPGRAMVAVILPSGLIYAAVGLSASFPLTAALLAAMGATIAVLNISAAVMLQSLTPPDMQGRAWGVLGTVLGGLQPLALGLAAPLVGLVGVGPLYLVCGLGVALGGALAMVLPGMAGMRRFATAAAG